MPVSVEGPFEGGRGDEQFAGLISQRAGFMVQTEGSRVLVQGFGD